MSSDELTYMYHHVVLPPKLPQKDDYDPVNELALLHSFRKSLNTFGALSQDRDTNDVVTTLHAMLTSSIKVFDPYGSISSGALIEVLKELSSSGLAITSQSGR